MAGDSLSLIRLLAFVGMVALQPSILAQNGPRELSRKLRKAGTNTDRCAGVWR